MFSFIKNRAAAIWLLSTLLCFGSFGVSGDFKSCSLPWLPINKMQHHNKPLRVLKTLSGKSEPNLVCLLQRVFDIQPFKLLGTFEMAAIFASTVIHISKIVFETSPRDT